MCAPGLVVAAAIGDGNGRAGFVPGDLSAYAIKFTSFKFEFVGEGDLVDLVLVSCGEVL
jgi:hypothetical protein